MPRYYRDDVRERSRDRRRPRSRDRSRERSRDRSRERFRRSPTHDHDDGDEGEVESGVFAWIPAAGIDFDVITEDLPLYMGADSKVERGKNPKDGRTPVYYIRGPYTLTVPMLSDLKRDTIDWEEERAKTGNKDYRRSETRNRRRGVGPTRKLANPAPVMTNPPQRTDSIPIPPGRRPEDPRASFVDASPRTTAQFPPSHPPERTSSRHQVPSRGDYNEPPRPTDTYPRREPSETTGQTQGRQPSSNPSYSSTANTQNISQTRNPAAPASQSANQLGTTRAEIEKRLAQKLRDEGRTGINRAEFDQAVDDLYRRLLEQQQAPPPYTTQQNTTGSRGVSNATATAKPPPQPTSTTATRGFSNPTATAGPKPDSGFSQYRY